MPYSGNVHEILLDGKAIILIGTAHISQSSVDEVNNKVHRINLENYNQLFFVLNSLLESSYVKKNREL